MPKKAASSTEEKGESVAILFSGGVDSTTAAVLAAERFTKVHLLTFDTGFLYHVRLSEKHVPTLKKVFGEDVIDHEIIDLRKLWRRYQLLNLRHEFWRTRSWFVLCMGCKLAMHAGTIRYCRKHGIKHAWGGENEGQGQYPEQKASILKELVALYREYGIEYDSPVYEYSNMEEDTKLQALGFKLGHHLKLFPSTKGSYHGTQPFCLTFPIYPIANMLPTTDEPVVEYFRRHVDLAREYIEKGTVGED